MDIRLDISFLSSDTVKEGFMRKSSTTLGVGPPRLGGLVIREGT